MPRHLPVRLSGLVEERCTNNESICSEDSVYDRSDVFVPREGTELWDRLQNVSCTGFFRHAQVSKT